jgi:hypothetical protein
MKPYYRFGSIFCFMLSAMLITYGLTRWLVTDGLIDKQLVIVDSYAHQRAGGADFARNLGLTGGAEKDSLFQMRNRIGLTGGGREGDWSGPLALGLLGLVFFFTGIYFEERSNTQSMPSVDATR